MLKKIVKYKGREYMCGIDFSLYANNGVLACIIRGGDEFPSVLTVNLNLIPNLAFGSFIDTNNAPETLEFLKDNDFGILTEIRAQSGFCTYPLFVFDKKLVKKANPETYDTYVKTFGRLYNIK